MPKGAKWSILRAGCEDQLCKICAMRKLERGGKVKNVRDMVLLL